MGPWELGAKMQLARKNKDAGKPPEEVQLDITFDSRFPQL
jgi:hypothetical protein